MKNISEDTDAIFPDYSDLMNANKIQEKTYALSVERLIMILAEKSRVEPSSIDSFQSNRQQSYRKN